MIFNKNAHTSLSREEGVHVPPRSSDRARGVVPEECSKSNRSTGKKDSSSTVVTSNKNHEDGIKKGGGNGLYKDTGSIEDDECSYIFDDEHFSARTGDVSDDLEKDIVELMLEESEMKKFYTIMANQKYGVPIKSSCVIINNNYVLDGKTISADQNDEVKEKSYLTIDEKLDVILYIVDLIWHQLNDKEEKIGGLDMKLHHAELNKTFERLHKMMIKLDEKLERALEKISIGDRKNDCEN